MADGMLFNPASNAAASKTLPLGTTARVTNVENGRTTTVRVRDRGPYRAGRIIDVSPGSAGALGIAREGVAPVAVAPLRVAKTGRVRKGLSWPRGFGLGGSGRVPGTTGEPRMTPEQVKAARKLLRWSVDRLGPMSDTSADAVQAYEEGGHIAKAYAQPVAVNPVDSIRAALEAAGVEVSERNGAARVQLKAIGD